METLKRKPRMTSPSSPMRPGCTEAQRLSVVRNGILRGKFGGDSVQVVGGLLGSDAWLDAADDCDGDRGAAMEVVRPFNLFLVDHGDPVVREGETFHAVKRGRCDADDRERMLVELNCGADDGWVCVKCVSPRGVTQNDVGRGVRTMLVCRVEEAACLWLHAEEIEVIASDFIAGDADLRVAPEEAGVGVSEIPAMPAKVELRRRRSSNAGNEDARRRLVIDCLWRNW